MKTAIMTGASSGIGRITFNRLLNQKDIQVIAGARSDNTNFIFVDLAKLDSVREFAQQVIARTTTSGINMLILNAGVQSNGEQRSAEGYELSFAVNHLSHYLLLRLLFNRLSEGARIIMTSSGTYDPAEKTIIPPPRHADPLLLAYPERDPYRDRDPSTAGGRAYSSSKLCVMLTVLALNSNKDLKQKNIRAIAYDPGPTPGTRLTRNRGTLIIALWKILSLPLLRNTYKGSNSILEAGNVLADIAMGEIPIDTSCYYAALRRGKIIFPPISDLARREDLARNLWKESALLCRIKQE